MPEHLSPPSESNTGGELSYIMKTHRKDVTL